jgi:hypothetical protein
MKLPPLVACLPLLASAGWFGPDGGEALVHTRMDVHHFRVIERESGGVNYYHVIEQPEGAILHAQYRPTLDSVTLGMEMPENLRPRVKLLRWRWRVQTFPLHGNDCGSAGDSAAAVFVTFKRGMKYYTLKYDWSTEGVKGTVCDQRRSMFYARDTILLESGGPTNVWVEESIDPRAEFLRHFEPNGTFSDVPDLVGIGLMTDGDQTKSHAEADYGFFVVGS